MEGNADGWPNAVYSELYNIRNGPSEMVKHGDLKYFRYHGRTGRSSSSTWPPIPFLERCRNLIDDPAYAADLQRLRARLDAFR